MLFRVVQQYSTSWVCGVAILDTILDSWHLISSKNYVGFVSLGLSISEMSSVDAGLLYKAPSLSSMSLKSKWITLFSMKFVIIVIEV